MSNDSNSPSNRNSSSTGNSNTSDSLENTCSSSKQPSLLTDFAQVQRWREMELAGNEQCIQVV